MTPRCWYVLWSVVLLHAFQGPLLAQEEDVREFLEQAKTKWDTYLRFANQLQGSGTTEVVDVPAKKGRRIESTLWRRPGCELYTQRSSRIDADGRTHVEEETAEGVNPQYSFEVMRRAKADEWIITSLEKRAGQSSYEHPPIQFLFVVGTLVLTDAVKDPAFRIESVKTLPGGGGKRLRFSRFSGQEWSMSGECEIDTELCWVVRSARSETRRGAAVVAEHRLVHEYRREGMFPIPERRKTVKRVDLGPKGWDHSEVTDVVNYSIPKELPRPIEFTLSAFGLAEPPWLTPATPEPAGVPWTIYGVAVGFGLLIVCILLSRRKAAAGGG